MTFDHVIHWFQQWHHVMLIALSMTQLHSLAHNDSNDMQHNFFVHVMSLILVVASLDANGIKNSTAAFFASRH